MIRLLIAFLLIPILTNAQHIIRGTVVDKESENPIAYATISLVGTKLGTTADFEGNFKFKIPDTTAIYIFEISALGYHKRQINTKDLTQIISLERQIYDIPAITVKGRKTKTKRMGVNLLSSKGDSYGTRDSFNFQAVLYVPNEHQIKGWVKSVSYYIEKERCIPNTPFRVIILDKKDTLKQPGKDILNKSIIISGDKNGGWVRVNFDSLYIPFVKNGIFVGMEWLYDSSKYHYKNGTEDWFGQCITLTPNISEHRTWMRLNPLEEWQFRDWGYADRERKKRPTNIMVSIEVEYYKAESNLIESIVSWFK